MGWQGGKPALLIHVAVQKTRDYFRNIICIVTTQAGNKKWALGSPDPAGRTVRTENKAGEKRNPLSSNSRFSHDRLFTNLSKRS